MGRSSLAGGRFVYCERWMVENIRRCNILCDTTSGWMAALRPIRIAGREQREMSVCGMAALVEGDKCGREPLWICKRGVTKKFDK